jgi:WhiB family redox-sensing transcriptional regulator
MPKFSEVNWEKGECFGTNTDLFYSVEEERSVKAYDYINAVRSICVRCPIWAECLSYAFKHEDYGVWGGMTSMERRSVSQPKKYPAQLRRARFDLEIYGLSWGRILEAYEHSGYVRSLADKPSNNREDGSTSNR